MPARHDLTGAPMWRSIPRCCGRSISSSRWGYQPRPQPLPPPARPAGARPAAVQAVQDAGRSMRVLETGAANGYARRPNEGTVPPCQGVQPVGEAGKTDPIRDRWHRVIEENEGGAAV